MVTLATALGYEDEDISLSVSAAAESSLRARESDALQNAHSEITQFIDLLGDSGDSVMTKPGRKMVPRLWRRSGAIAVTKTAISLIRYPLYTGTMYAQITGSGRSAWWAGTFGVFKRWWTIPLGAVLHDFSGGHLGIVGGVVSLFNFKSWSNSSLWKTLANICLHYWSFRILYGAFRQVLVTRLATYVPISSAIMPALTWMRDRMLMRPDPYGSFLSVYVRDVCVSLFQGGLTLWLSRMLTSERAVGLYFSIAKFDVLYRNALATLLDCIGLPSSTQASGNGNSGSYIARMLGGGLHTPLHPEGRANLSAAIAAEDGWELVEYSHDNSDPDIIFSNNFDTTPPPPPLRRRQRRGENQQIPPPPPLSTTKEMAQELQFLIYTETVGAIVSGILTRAIFYPVNAVVLRLMADQVGLTSHGYTGFFNVLSSCTLSSLYSGFATSLVSDLVVGWLATEMAHYLCKTAWISI